jgi:hypothetical protein
MANILQFDQQGNMVHSHSYTPTAGTLRDLTTDRRYFYTVLSGGSVDQVRITGQSVVVDNAGTGNAIGSSISTIARRPRRHRDASKMLISGGTFLNNSILGYHRFTGSSYVRIVPRYATSPITFGGLTSNGRDNFAPFDRQAAPFIRRMVWARTEDPRKQPITLVNSDTGWGGSADSLRGAAVNRKDFWILWLDSTTTYLQLFRNDRNPLKLVQQIDISAHISSEPRGLCFDGWHLYVGDDS